MGKYRGVFFDLDGTLADTDLMIVQTMLKIYQEYAPEYKPSLKELLSFSGPPLSVSLKEHFPTQDTTLLIERFRTLSPTLYDKYVKLFPQVQETLKFLKEHNYKLVIITSKMHEATIYTLQLLDIYNYFDFLICVDDVEQPKPHPEGIHKALDLCHFRSEDILYVGDTMTDFQVAEAAHVDCALVGWGIRGVPLKAKPHFILQQFKELEEVVENESTRNL